jgi:hypothetical protein
VVEADFAAPVDPDTFSIVLKEETSVRDLAAGRAYRIGEPIEVSVLSAPTLHARFTPMRQFR